MNSTVSPPFNESNSLRIRPVDGMRETKRASSPSNQQARTVLMRLPPGEIKLERGQTGGDLHPANLRAHSDAAVPWQ